MCCCYGFAIRNVLYLNLKRIANPYNMLWRIANPPQRADFCLLPAIPQKKDMRLSVRKDACRSVTGIAWDYASAFFSMANLPL